MLPLPDRLKGIIAMYHVVYVNVYVHVHVLCMNTVTYLD